MIILYIKKLLTEANNWILFCQTISYVIFISRILNFN